VQVFFSFKLIPCGPEAEGDREVNYYRSHVCLLLPLGDVCRSSRVLIACSGECCIPGNSCSRREDSIKRIARILPRRDSSYQFAPVSLTRYFPPSSVPPAVLCQRQQRSLMILSAVTAFVMFHLQHSISLFYISVPVNIVFI